MMTPPKFIIEINFKHPGQPITLQIMAAEGVSTAQWARPFYLMIIRMSTVTALAITTCFTFGLTDISGSFPPFDMFYFPFVNIVYAVIIPRTFHQHRTPVQRYLGFEKTRLRKDIAWGFLWLIITYIPLFVVLTGLVYLVFGSDMSQHLEQVFARSSLQLPVGVLAVMNAFGVVASPVDASIEETVYHGRLQDGLAERRSITVTIVVRGLVFDSQCTMFAVDGCGMITHGFVFSVWGVTAGVIAHEQQRLAPMVTVHQIADAASGVGPMLMLGLMGVQEVQPFNMDVCVPPTRGASDDLQSLCRHSPVGRHAVRASGIGPAMDEPHGHLAETDPAAGSGDCRG